jgi:hypothetical protein
MIVTAVVSLHVIRQQTRGLKRDARAQALKDFCAKITDWMHGPNNEKWVAMADEFWRGRLWLTNEQAKEIRQQIDSYKPSQSKQGGEYETGEAIFAILTKDIV